MEKTMRIGDRSKKFISLLRKTVEFFLLELFLKTVEFFFARNVLKCKVKP